MDVIDSNARPSAALPSINMLDVKRNDSVTTGLPSTQLQPYTPHSSATGPPSGSTSRPLSPPHSRRTSGDDKDHRAVPRQSLPSIHEALRGDISTSFSVQAPTSGGYYQTHSPPSSARRTQTNESFPPPSTNGYSQQNSSPYSQRAEIVPPPPVQNAPQPPPTSDARNPALHALRTSSPVEPPRYPYARQQSPAYEVPPPQTTPQHTSQPPYQAYQAPPTSVPPHVGLSRPGQAPAPYAPAHAADLQRMEDSKRAGRVAGPAYGESVKRHLENFDYEASLNEVADANSHLLEFSNYYRRLAHQSQRSGLVIGSIPSIADVEEMLRKSQQMHQALVRVKDIVVAQNATASEQLAQEERLSAQESYRPDEHQVYQDESKSTAGFAGPDAKKRRGRAAPPGRCHSCNRAETPEWRRGPDGARTLCNACGLHYAKLTRKLGTNKPPVGGSNLRPKGPGSPIP